MLKKSIIASLFLSCTALQAADLSSVDCTPPKLIVTFASAVQNWAASGASDELTKGLTSLKFKATTSSASSVELNPRNSLISGASTVFTLYVPRADYEDTYSWNVWPVAVEATADGDTSTVSCN